MDSFINKGNTLMFLYVPIAIVITSFYLFPFEFSFAIGYNTKMIMAALGLILFFVQLAEHKISCINHDLYIVIYWAFIVSVCGLISVMYNNTGDYTYSTYIISMLVWLSAANVVVTFLRFIHGYISISLICKYLIIVCFLQCVLAIIIDSYLPLKNLVNSYVANFSSSVSTGNSLDSAGRLYGIGAALDIAGSRFSVILVIISYLVINKSKSKIDVVLYLFYFVFILIVGCSIGRTTMIGAILAILYWIYALNVIEKVKAKRFIFILCTLLLIAVPIVVFLYNNDINFHNNIRFGFEGFFNYAETGVWSTSSTDTLKTMYIFPENIKTWLIGDGYFADPSVYDPYYTGKSYSAFYMGVDVGYLRFIYYFGIIGLIAFTIYFIKVCWLCVSRFVNYKMLFFLILSINFIVWFKVATDIFLVFALFLCISKEENDMCDNVLR